MTSEYKKHCAFKNRMIFIGFGSIGQGVLPLIFRHIDIKPQQIMVIAADDRGQEEITKYGIEHVVMPLTSSNYHDILAPRLGAGDFIVNVSVDVSTAALIELCQEKNALYIDTMIEVWPEEFDGTTELGNRTAYALREQTLERLRISENKKSSTALLIHGANPGLANHFVKQALLNMARDTGIKAAAPKTQEEWARLAETLGIKAIHCAERDTQRPSEHKQRGEFVNTWSIDGFFDEGYDQPAELGWGTHEKGLPKDGFEHSFGSRAAIYLGRPGWGALVRSWTPLEGPYHGFLVSHYESISLAEYLSVHENGKLRYRPTCHYAYYPCDVAVLSIHEVNGNGRLQDNKRLITDEITEGMDELGVLLMGNKKGVYWYGSRLTIDEARQLAPYNNATTLQVTASVLAGIIWCLENPTAGVIEPEQVDFQRILEIASPYLGEVVGVWGDWNPLKNRMQREHEDIDASDPWQFKNILVA